MRFEIGMQYSLVLVIGEIQQLVGKLAVLEIKDRQNRTNRT